MSITALGIDFGKALLYVCLMSGKPHQDAAVFENMETGHQQCSSFMCVSLPTYVYMLVNYKATNTKNCIKYF